MERVEIAVNAPLSTLRNGGPPVPERSSPGRYSFRLRRAPTRRIRRKRLFFLQSACGSDLRPSPPRAILETALFRSESQGQEPDSRG